jgi:hypothetical protein
LVWSAVTTLLGVPVGRQNGSLIGLRSMPKDNARRSPVLFTLLAISGSAS